MPKLYYFIPAWACTCVVVGLSVAPGRSMPHFTLWDILSADKIGHFSAYASIVITWLWGLYKYMPLPQKVHFQHKVVVLVSAILLGVIMEWVQGTFFPDRFLELADMIANAIGAIMGLYLINTWLRTRP